MGESLLGKVSRTLQSPAHEFTNTETLTPVNACGQLMHADRCMYRVLECGNASIRRVLRFNASKTSTQAIADTRQAQQC